MKFFFFLGSLLLFQGCDHPFFTLLWHKFEHPTYKFSIRVPRSWTIKQDDLLGVAVSGIANNEEETYKTNFNIVVQPIEKNVSLEQLEQISKQQLSLIFNQYQFLGRFETHLGTLKGVELRGRYYGLEGTRIMRSVLAIHKGNQYIFTFTVSENQESKFVDTFDAITETFSP